MAKLRDKVVTSNQDSPQQCLQPNKLFEFEKRSLSLMVTMPWWPRALSHWKNSIIDAQRQAANNGILNAYVSFEATNPRVEPQESMHCIELGVQIVTRDKPLVTYFFAIGKKDSTNKKRGLRKVHFDLEYSSNGTEPKPMVHLQIAGGFPPVLSNAGYDSSAFDHLNPTLEKPRVPCLPPSFALLAHLAFLEYHCNDLELTKFIKSSHWLSVVTQAEKAILKPFYHHGNSWLDSSKREKQSLLSCFYGLAGL